MQNLFTNLNLNFTLILMIVGITEYFKNLKTIKEKVQRILKRTIPVIMSFAIGFFITNPFDMKTFVLNSLIYFGVSTLLYSAVLKFASKGFSNLMGASSAKSKEEIIKQENNIVEEKEKDY